jgi:hypothetical protein
MEKRILISSYKSVIDKEAKDVDFLNFINGIKSGSWQDQVLQVRTILDKKLRAEAKQKCPLVTVSGSFIERKDSSIRLHSGFIAIDLDNVENVNLTKEILAKDPYVFSAFTSISGNGLCAIFKIDGDRHLEAFNSIAAYLYQSYQLIVDQSGKNVSRARFVSFDPFLHLNENALQFKKYLPKEKPKKVSKVVYVKSDFDAIIKQMYDRSVNICEDYADWVSVAYALISQFGEGGIDYFHTLSSISSKYDSLNTERQYQSCLKNNAEKGKQATIATIYYHAKQAGIDTYSEKTKGIIRAATMQTKSGVKKDGIQKSLQMMEGIPLEESADIIDQVLAKDIKHKSESVVDDVVNSLKNYKIKKNTITRNVEWNIKPIDDSDINSIFLDLKSAFKEVTKDLVCSVLFSNRIDSYNPIHTFFAERGQPNLECPNINLLLSSVISDTPNFSVWMTKWLVSAIASSYGKHSPLVLVFCGEVQGTGKTHWFRYLLPQQLQSLFAESKMDAGKDDEILMTKKWIILDDEYGGKSKREEKRLKEITSKQWINVREPYGRVSVDLKRLAVFCGTSNDVQILNDPTGNRRIIPIHIMSIDQDKYNQCDKEMLWIELHQLYKSGYDYTILKDEIIQLNTNTEEFKQSTPEEELIFDKISPGNANSGEWMTVTAIIQYLIEGTKYNTLSPTKVGIILSNQNFEKKRIRKEGDAVRAYLVAKLKTAFDV